MGASLAMVDFILAALFLWIVCFLEARSAKEITFRISVCFLLFFAERIAFSRRETIKVFTIPLRLLPLSALFAVLVTGILPEYN